MENFGEVRDFLNNIFFYRRFALVIALTVALLGLAAAVLIPPSFTARARLLTLNASVYDMQPGTTANAPVQDPTAAVNTEMQLLASPELHRTLVRTELGPGATVEEVNRRVRRFEAHFHVSKVEAANVIELEFSDPDPEHAASALRMLLAAYFDERAKVLTSGRVGFLTDQRDKVSAQLDQANAQIAAYEKQNGIVDVAAQVAGAVDFDNQLKQQQQIAEAALADSRRSVLVLLDSARNVPRQIELYSDNTEATHTIGTMETALFQLEAKRADLASRYMPGSPFVKEVEAQIREMNGAIAAQRSHLATASRTGHNSDYDTVQDRLTQAEAGLNGASARLAVLNGQIASSRDHLKSLIAVSDTLTQLRMQRDLLADTVRSYSTQLEQARIQQNQATTAGSTNVRVIEEPIPPSRRNNPPLLIIAASLFSAIFIAAVAVFVLSSLRETFLSPQEAERALKLPVLCDIPRQGALHRQFGRLIAAIGAPPMPGRWQTSSTSSGTGKVVLLLTALSQADLEQTAQSLTTALAHREPGRVALLRLTERSSDAGENVADSMRVTNGIATMTQDIGISREHLQSLLAEVRASYAYTILQPPPTSFAYESVECSSVADFVLLVVQAEQTRRPVAQTIIDQVAQLGRQVQGVIMVGRKFYIPGWVYSFALNRKRANA